MLFFSLIVVTISHYHITFAVDSCGIWNTCQDCIKDPSICVWCAKDDFTGPRCKINSTANSEWCSDLLQNPINSKIKAKNANFSLAEHIIQIKPQMYTMKLRPGKPQEFEFYFQAAQDFPVDLYFLLDASKTMAKMKNTTAEQAENIYKTIESMTKDVYLGFGSFVDKSVLPFSTNFNTTNITNYSFRHRLSLTNNLTRFKEVVPETPVGMNRDDPEAGLDALAQVMACKNLIRWRNESRKIIIYLSDGPYHVAGDGKVAGLFQPYDGGCYTETDLYTKEIEMDYPSVGIINKLAVERNMVILFFVLEDVEDIYQSLSAEIRDSKVSTFKEHSGSKADETLVTTLKNIYEKISKKITLNYRVKSGRRQNVDISFMPDCTSEASGSDCDVEIGKEKKIVGTINLLEFIDHKLYVDIGIESIEEKLTLEIEAVKSCDCEANNKVNSTFCNGGVRSCGICDCGTNRYGERCACEKNIVNNFNDSSTCFLQGTDVECSGHGTCVCGSCRCSDGFSGKYCDCNNEGCPRDATGKLCSGQTHGNCVCGECKCKPEWNGKACDCLNYDCKMDGKVCYNRGDCICGSCHCHEIPDWDMRTQDIKNCKMFARPDTRYRQCIKLESCAKCRRIHDVCLSCDDDINAYVTQTLPKEYVNSNTWEVCQHLNVDIGCYAKFAYRYDNENVNLLHLVVELDKNCTKTYYVFGGVSLLILVVVGVLMLVCWKLMMDARDRLEYKKFKKNKEDEGSFVNPLYQKPSSSFNNPMFRKRSYR